MNKIRESKLKIDKDKLKNDFNLFLKKAKENNHNTGIFYTKEDIDEDENKLYKKLNGNYKDFYKNICFLGEGTLGRVKKTKNLLTGEICAVKIINSRDEEIIFQIKQEFKNMKNLSHENIIEVKELLIDRYKAKIYLIMEYFEGKEMFEYISEQGIYKENFAKIMFKKLLLGIDYLHSKGIIHRDLKPNNLLVSNDGKLLKIADFNIAKFTNVYNDYNSLKKDNYKMHTYTGTLSFNAPEIFSKKSYTELVDCWSAGCVLYTMLIGKQPFYKEHIKDLINQIKNCDYDKQNEEWNYLSINAQNLIESLLMKDPMERLTPLEALNHNWFSSSNDLNLNNCLKIINKNRQSLIKNFDIANINDRKWKSENQSFSIYLRKKTLLNFNIESNKNINSNKNIESFKNINLNN